MQTWPSHHRSPSLSAKSNNRNKETTGNNYPVYGHGNLEAATLIQRNGRFEWDSLISSSPTRSRFHLVKAFNVFPVTKSPPLPKPTTTINQRADQGAHFLRTRFPEVDISADVIRSQIKEDSLQAAELVTFDPFEGNLLDIAVDYRKKKYLVFPTGELSSQLNFTPIAQGEDGKTVIKPTVTPVRTFSTPIQQIALSPAPTIGETAQSDRLLGIRTFGATSLLKFDPAAIASGGVRDLTYFTSHDLDSASVMDFKICSVATPFGLLLVNKKGGIYGCNLAGGRKTIVKLYAELESPSKSSFWKVGTGSKPTGCTVLSGKTFNHLDFRSNELVPLYSASGKDFLTSSEDYSQDDIHRLCSTSQIVWIDPRYPGKHLLGCKHFRQFERTLQTSTLFLDGSPTTFLSSRRNGLFTIYNVSRHEDHLVRVNDTPYGVLTSGTFRQFAGQVFLKTDPRTITIFRADERGGVDAFQLQNTTDDSTNLPDTITMEESDVIQGLRERAVNMKSDVDIFGDREKLVMDLFPAYSNAFQIHVEQPEEIDENNTENEEEREAEEFYDLIDRLPTFWQTSDIPSGHMLTSYDIAFRSHEGPSKSSRSDFTTGSLINSARGYRAILQDMFPIEELRMGAPWHFDTTETQNRIDPSLDINIGARDLAHSLRSYDLIKDDDRTALSIRRENSAREHLVVDLTLSKDVYSPSGFTPPREVGNDLEAMTEALSLGGDNEDEPPEVEFGCLAPIIRKCTTQGISREHDEEITTDPDGRVTLPMGVRLLLKDWEVGTRVKDYVYQDPYNSSGDSAPRFPTMSKLQRVNTMPSSSQVMNSQRPPTILSSQPTSHALGSVSQPLPVPVRSQYSSVRSTFDSRTVRQSVDGDSRLQVSQDSTYQPNPVANTQILSGPHGGRPSIPRKKPAKKRLGGF